MASTALLNRSLAGDTDHWKTCIPKEPGLPVEPPKDDEGSILDTVRKSYLWKDNTPDLYVPTEVNLVDNKTLVKKYLAKKETMKTKGRSTGDCQDVYTFAIERLSNLTNICHDGPVSRPAKRHLLGDSRLGFRVWQHADVCLHIGARMNRNPLALVIYKVMLGRRKMLHLEHYTNVHNALKPTPGYDCHMSSTQASPMDVTQVAANLDQVYLYDCDGDTHTRRHVSHCLPYAVVIYARQFLPKPASADSMMPRSSLLNDSHPSPRTNAQTKQHTLEGNSDEERCSSLSPEGTVAWGHTDFTVTHWRKLLSRRSIEELEDVSLTHGKSSENYISEIGSCDQLPNLVVKRVVTHGCPLSVKKAALQWKVRRINKLRPSRRNFSARPRLTHRLLSDRFSEICTNVKYKEAVLSETRKARIKTTLTQHNEILCQLSQSCRAPACLQGELRETEEQDTTSVPVMANSGLHELADAEMVADSTCSPRPRKRKKIARDSRSEGNLWQSQVIEGSRLKVNFRRITSPTSKPSVTCSPNSTTSPSKKPSVTCSPNITTSPSRKPSVTCSPNITTSPSRKPSVTCSPNSTTSSSRKLSVTCSPNSTTSYSRKLSVTCSPNSTTSSSRKLLVTCSPNSTTSSSRKLSVTCSPNSTTSSSRKPSVTCSPNNIMSSSRKPSVTCNPNRLVPYDGSNDECCHGDVEPCSIQTGVSSQVPVLVKQSSDHHESHDNKSVTVAPIQRRHSPVKRCFVDLGSPVRGESYTSTGVKPLCDGTHSGEYVDVQLQAQATGSDVHTDVKHVTKVPATSSDINPTVKVPTTGGDTHATVKHVMKVPATCGDTHAAVIKSVTKAAETGCEIHADVKKLAALMTLESYWSVAEALGTAKRTKTSQRQKSSDRNLEKSSGSKVPRRQSNSSECSKSSKKKSTSCYGVISSMKKTSRKHRKTHRKTSGESVRTSMEDGEVYPVSGMAQVSDAVKPSLSGDVERLDSVHVCDMAGGCMHVAGVGVTWSTNTEPVFSAREQPAFHKSIQSSASMMFMLDKPTTKVSGIEVKAVGKETKLDGTEMKLPENESNISEAEVKGFGKQVKLPENEVKLSNYSGEVELPVVGVKQCENVVKLHDTGMSPCNVPCAVYYTDICQSDSGTDDELPLSTHVPVTVHRETNVWQSQAIEGSSLKVSVGCITSPSNKTLFACSQNRLVAYDGSESIQLPWEWSSDHHGSRDSKSVANAPIQRGHLPVKQRSCLTADSYTFTGVNPLCDRTHSEECIDVKHVTEVAASDELSCSKRVAAPLTPESYWSVAEAICTATRTKSCQRQKTSERNSEKSSGSKVLHGQSNRMASSKSPNKMKVSETEVKVPGKEVKLPEKQMNVSDAKRKVFDKERKPDTQLLEDKVSNTNGKVFGKEGKPSTQLKLPENKTKVSDIKRKVSNKEGNPSTQVQLSENETKVSDTKWKVFGKEVKSAGTQLKLPENKLKVSDTKRKLFGKEGKPGTQLKAPENVKVSAMACKEPKTMKVKLPGMEMKPCKIVMSSCDDPCAVYYTDIGQPDSGTDDDGFSQKVGDSASRPPFPQTCDHLTRKEGPKSDKMANFFANSSLYIYLRQKLSGKGQSEETITTSDFTPSLPESPIPVGRVAETRSVKPSTSTYVQARDASQNLTDTDLKNGDTISRKGFPEMLALVDGVSETYCVKPSTLTYVPPRAVSQNVTDTDLTNGDTVSRRGFPELLAPVGRVSKTHHVKPSASTYAPPRTASQNVTDTDLTNGDSVSRRGFPELLQPMDSVSETCRVIPSTSTHVPTRAVSQNVNTDLTNVDTSRRGTGGTRSKIWCVSSCLGKQGEDKKEVSGKEKSGRVRGSTGNSIQHVSWSGKVNSGRVEETTGNNMQQGKNWAAGKFHGRTLLSGEDVPARMIPFHPLYLFHPIRRSGRPEEIPRDPRPAHYVRKQIQLSSQQLASLLGVTRKDVTFGGSADKAATGVLRPKCGAHGTGSATNQVVHRHAQLLFNDGGDYTNVQAGDEDMDIDSS